MHHLFKFIFNNKHTQSLRKGLVRAVKSSIFIIHYSLLLIAFLVTCSITQAQNITATAKLDTTQIRIGEQFGMNLNITAPAGTKIFFPLIPDTIHKIEVVKRPNPDTLKSADGKSFTLHQRLTLTCFDSGYYVIEPIPFFFQRAGKSDTDSVSTEAQLVSVITIPIDTTKGIKDIKPPLDVPYTFRDALPFIIGALILFAVIMIVVYFMMKKKATVVIKPKIPDRPAHEIALEALKKTEAEKLWQQGYFKRYHSEVSDIIRTYIEHRFSVNAMEFTTDETLDHLRENIINGEAGEKLKNILQLADMVKFAKVQPVANENEQSISDAYRFIMLTKPVTQDDFKEKEKEVAS